MRYSGTVVDAWAAAVNNRAIVNGWAAVMHDWCVVWADGWASADV